jgi:threonyl-tRNA synthetase
MEKNNNNIDILRHSTSHVMAQAVCELFDNVKLAIGPSIEDGFYYDFDLKKTFTPEDLVKIESKMQEIINRDLKFIRKEISKTEAKELFKNNKYKLELISEIPGDTVTIYQNGSFFDLCKGPHIESTGKIKYFKLLSIAGAYWRGDEHREQLQRIYGTAFYTKQELDDYLFKLEEAKKRDHRKLGQELDLFSIHSEVGAGLIHWHPKGTIIRTIIENYWKEQHIKNGYQLVNTPHIASEEIYRISGHLEKYSDLMYSSMDIEGVPYRVKPMNCPNHIMIYKTKLHSYRELPIRLAELGTVYRYEKSGVLHGLLRVRGFTIDDAHIFCREEQLEQEMMNIFKIVLEFLSKFGFNEYSIYIATRPEKYVGSTEIWDKATNVLKSTMDKIGYKYEIDEGGGAFYGPKVDVKVKDAIGRVWQCSTIQFDFNLPQRFNITYRDESGKDVNVVMIHRAILGSMERFLGILIENYAGKFPFWIAPVQIIVMTVSEKQIEYATQVKDTFVKHNFRTETNFDNQTIGNKIRTAISEKIPYFVIIGEKEKETKTISVRKLSGETLNNINIDDFISRIKKEQNF